MIPVDNEMVVTTLPFPVLIPVDNDLITMLPFPMLIPVDNDPKSLALSVITTIGRDTEPVVVDTEPVVGSGRLSKLYSRPKEELPVEPKPLQEVHQLQDFSDGARVPNENRYWTTDICTSVFYPVRMKRENNPSKWGT